MDRRGFFRAASALAAAIGVRDISVLSSRPSWMGEFLRTGVLRGERIVLSGPLVLDREYGPITIENCTFERDDESGPVDVTVNSNCVQFCGNVIKDGVTLTFGGDWLQSEFRCVGNVVLPPIIGS